MTTNQYLNESYAGPDKNRSRLTCNDGFSMSIQASRSHYCSPRETLDAGSNYDAVEIGYPSDAEDLLMPYAENSQSPTETVYGFVPVEVVDAVIAKHGDAK